MALTTRLNYSEIEINNEIMSTDVYLFASSEKFSKKEIQNDLEQGIKMFKSFEKRFSRFIENNELFAFNNSENLTISDYLFEMLILCKKYYKETNGFFNPTIINTLINSGYSKSVQILNDKVFSMDEIRVDEKNKQISKPIDLSIDLGGIGKSFIVKKVSEFLSSKYDNYCVNAGGDMYLSGIDTLNNYPYWAIRIENLETPTLIVNNMGICTSGVNRKKWILNGQSKNHLIDPFKNESVQNEIITATVVSGDVVKADVYAKCLVLMGLKNAQDFSQNKDIASVIITKDGGIFISSKAKKYVWKED